MPRKLFPKFSVSELVMIVIILVLVICILSRWEYISGEVSSTVKGMFGQE